MTPCLAACPRTSHHNVTTPHRNLQTPSHELLHLGRCAAREHAPPWTRLQQSACSLGSDWSAASCGCLAVARPACLELSTRCRPAGHRGAAGRLCWSCTHPPPPADQGSQNTCCQICLFCWIPKLPKVKFDVRGFLVAAELAAIVSALIKPRLFNSTNFTDNCETPMMMKPMSSCWPNLAIWSQCRTLLTI